MIPNEEQARALWDKYQLPEGKRRHVELVARVALFLAQHIDKVTKRHINQSLLQAAALLHDIDKNILMLSRETHPDAAVRILNEEGMGEVAALVATHPLHAILAGSDLRELQGQTPVDPAICPKTWEEKLLFLADKMVKDDVIGVDARFALWNEEHQTTEEQAILDAAYPKVKELEKEILAFVDTTSEDVARVVKREYP